MHISPGLSYNDKLRGLPEATLLFSADETLMYYLNRDSLRIEDMNTVAGDVVYNPSKYKLMGNTIRVIGDTCEILLLNKEILVLKRIDGGYIRVYMPSKWQDKIEVKRNR